MLGHQSSKEVDAYVGFATLTFILWLFLRPYIVPWLQKIRSSSAAEKTPKHATEACEVPNTSSEQAFSSDNNNIIDNPVISAEASNRCRLRGFSLATCRRVPPENDLEIVISSPSLFMSQKDLDNLTVREITSIFRYATEVNRMTFERTAFVSKLSSRVTNVLAAMDVAVSASRGSTVGTGRVLGDRKRTSVSGNIDALYFLAAVRVFADWRCTRLVPEGYRRYSMSVSLGRRDLVQNIGKAERAIHRWIKARQEASLSHQDGDNVIREYPVVSSPTIDELLQWEVETLHENLPTLSEESAATGILWISRQLMYHASMVRNSLQVPNIYPTTHAAAEAAYEEIYSDCHRWTTKQIFRRSLQGAPEFSEILKFLEDDYNDGVQDVHWSAIQSKQSLSRTISTEKPNSNVTCRDFRSSPVQPASPAEKFLEDLKSKWTRALTNLSRFNCQDVANPKHACLGPLVIDFDLHKGKSASFGNLPDRTRSDVSDTPTEEMMTSASSCSSKSDDEVYPISFLEQDFADHAYVLAGMQSNLQQVLSAKNLIDPQKV